MRRRRFLAMLGVTGMVAGSAISLIVQPAAAASFPVPSPINVTNITATSFDLQIGRVGAVKQFEYTLTSAASTTGGIFGTYKGTVTVKQNTDYSLKVREVDIHTGDGGPFSVPKLFHTPAYVAPPKPATPGNVTATAVTQTSVTLSYTSSPNAVTYRYFLDGKLAGTGGPTGATIAVSPGTTYAIQVDAVNAAGVRSNRASLTVTTPGTAVAVSRPSAPPNLTAGVPRTDGVSLFWDRSSDPVFPNTDLLYRVFVDGVPNGQFDGYQSCQYCFDPGFTGGGAIFLSPQTTYTIGVAARNPNGVESVLSTIVITTAP